MAGAIITKPMQVETPQDLGASYIIRTGEIINEGDLVGLDGNGLLVASLNGTFPTSPLGCAFFDSANASTYRTGDGVMKASIARRAKIRNANSTLVPGLAKGAPLYLSLITTPTTSNYTCVPPSSQGNNTLSVGYVDSDGTTLIVDVQSGGAAGSIGLVGIAGLKNALASAARSGWQVIGYRGGCNTGFSGTSVTSDTGRSRIPTVYAFQSIILVFANFVMVSGSHEGSGANSVDVMASIEDTTLITGLANGNTVFPAFFNGRSQATMDANAWLFSDPIEIFGPANWALFVRTNFQVASGDKYPNNAFLITGSTSTVSPDGRGSFEGLVVGDVGGALTAAGTVTPSSSSVPPGPVAVLGLVGGNPRPVMLFTGDSNMVGAYDSYGPGTTPSQEITAHGYGVRAASLNSIPYMNFSVSGETATWCAVQSQTKLRMTAAHQANAVCISLGTNDLASLTAAQIETDIIAYATRFKAAGKVVIVCTIPPKQASSSDHYLTVAGQTVGANEAVRVAANGLIRNSLIADALGIVDYIWDICTPIEVNVSNVLTQNGGYMIVPPLLAVVPAGTASNGAGTIFQDSSDPFTSDMLGAYILVTAGTGIGTGSWIITFTNTGQVSTLSKITVGADSAYTVFWCPYPNQDGIHLGVKQNDLVAQSFNPAWANIV
jgi:hypothetical protein